PAIRSRKRLSAPRCSPTAQFKKKRKCCLFVKRRHPKTLRILRGCFRIRSGEPDRRGLRAPERRKPRLDGRQGRVLNSLYDSSGEITSQPVGPPERRLQAFTASSCGNPTTRAR